MPGIESPAEKVQFDVFEVNLRAGELLRAGRKIKLQEQPFRVLSLLLQRAGQIVTRDELREKLWPADTFVDFDHGLNSAVARLREALGDSAENPCFIETIAKRGYRFIGLLKADEQRHVRAETPLSRKTWKSFLNSRRVWIGTIICLALLCSASIWALYRPAPNAQLAKIEVVPLAGLRGFQATPAFSPDGTLVAFRQSDGAQKTGIYAAVVGGDRSIQLTSGSGDCCPTWSPDGSEIAFSRYSEENVFSIFTVSALGGTEHRLYRGPDHMGSGISWSPDGRLIAFTESHESDPTRSWISVLSVADSSTRQISSPPPGWIDRSPIYSPDGRRIAFIRATVAGVSNDIYVMGANGGHVKRLTFDHRPIAGSPAWTSDSKEIVFSSARGATMGLWIVAADGCVPRPVAGPVGGAGWPSIPANREDTLVYEQWLGKADVWRLDLNDAEHLRKPPYALVSEKGDKMRPEFSPDGKKVAFESDRLGFWDIWTCDVDGSSCDQITSLHGTAGRARWSPNGRYIAFEFHPNERSEIYIVEVPGGTPRLLPTIPGADNLSPSWSRDGKWLYFASKRGEEPFQIWRVPLQGAQAPVRLTQNGGISPVESYDGRYLYYAKFEQGGVWRIPLQGAGEEVQVLSDGGQGGWPNWALSPQGIYFLSFSKSPLATINFLDLSTGKTQVICKLDKKLGWGMSLSADGKSILYVQDQFAESNLMMVKNFR